MFKLMTSMVLGLGLASVVGLSAAASGATSPGKTGDVQEASSLLKGLAERPDGPFYTKDDADADVNYRIGQGYTNVYETYDDSADIWYVNFS